jgi:hypothetical protein
MMAYPAAFGTLNRPALLDSAMMEPYPTVKVPGPQPIMRQGLNNAPGMQMNGQYRAMTAPSM